MKFGLLNIFGLSKKFSFLQGRYIPAPRFFWINDQDLIGFEKWSCHGNSSDRHAGSVNDDDFLYVKEVSSHTSTVSVIKKFMPYGAPTAYGTIFKIDNKTLYKWHNDIEYPCITKDGTVFLRPYVAIVDSKPQFLEMTDALVFDRKLSEKEQTMYLLKYGNPNEIAPPRQTLDSKMKGSFRSSWNLRKQKNIDSY